VRQMNDFVIVTGGAGFIGCNVVRALNSRGLRDILIVDDLGSDAKWRNLIGLDYEDILPIDEFLPWLTQTRSWTPTSVVHMGACSSTTEQDADYLLRNNYRYTRRACEWSVENGVRFVYASSAATYGDGSLGYGDTDEVTRALRPMNMYGYSKHQVDLWVLANGLFKTIVGLKFFNVYGPHEDHKGDMRSVVAKAYDEIVETGHLSLFKSYRSDFPDGEQKRDFVYVDDAVAVVLHFLDHRDVSGLFNCGTGRSRSWLDLARAVFVALGVAEDVRFIDMPIGLRSKYQYFTQADISKLRASGYSRDFSGLEDSVSTYVRQYLSRRE